MEESKTQGIERLTKRHIAKLLSRLEENGTPSLVRDEVKKHIWYLSQDIVEQVLNNESMKG